MPIGKSLQKVQKKTANKNLHPRGLKLKQLNRAVLRDNKLKKERASRETLRDNQCEYSFWYSHSACDYFVAAVFVSLVSLTNS